VFAFTLYGICRSLRNTIVGLQGVDQTLVEAGRGDGHVRGSRCSFRIELPLAVPVIMAGVRTALVPGRRRCVRSRTFIDAGGAGCPHPDRHHALPHLRPRSAAVSSSRCWPS
jgi:osmoprotectant transport system permease protein